MATSSKCGYNGQSSGRVALIGPVVDVEFEGVYLPPIYQPSGLCPTVWTFRRQSTIAKAAAP